MGLCRYSFAVLFVCVLSSCSNVDKRKQPVFDENRVRNLIKNSLENTVKQGGFVIRGSVKIKAKGEVGGYSGAEDNPEIELMGMVQANGDIMLELLDRNKAFVGRIYRIGNYIVYEKTFIGDFLCDDVITLFTYLELKISIDNFRILSMQSETDNELVIRCEWLQVDKSGGALAGMEFSDKAEVCFYIAKDIVNRLDIGVTKEDKLNFLLFGANSMSQVKADFSLSEFNHDLRFSLTEDVKKLLVLKSQKGK